MSSEDEPYEEDEEVVALSSDQRAAEDGEPVCIVCGRYGAYICDMHDVDVCSMECKGGHKMKREEEMIREEDTRGEEEKEKKRAVVPVKSTLAVTNLASEQRPALPQEKGCALCKVRAGALSTLDDAKVCSLQCNEEYLTPARVISHPPFKVHPDLSSLSCDELATIRAAMQLRVSGDAAPVILDFKHVTLNDTLRANVSACGFELPTAIQSQVIPAVLDGRDVLASAPTGAGKTGAFLIPVIHRLSIWTHHIQGPLALVLCPTRELAIQIETVAKVLCAGLAKMRTALIVGGLSTAQQQHRLNQGVQLVIATPGRLVELAPELPHCYTLVIDEVDAMFDASFQQQVRSVIKLIPAEHQTLLLSATVSPKVERLCQELLCEPVLVSVGVPSTPADNVSQTILWIETNSKKKTLLSILQDKKHFKPPVLLFVESKLGCLFLAEYLLSHDVMCSVLHGDKTQLERNNILTEFKSGRYPVLVCTNVLGRGIELVDVSQVILFDFPSSTADYIHQIGRAGSLKTKGVSLSFINDTNKAVFKELIDTLKPSGVRLPPQLVNSPHLAYQRQNSEYQHSEPETSRKRFKR